MPRKSRRAHRDPPPPELAAAPPSPSRCRRAPAPVWAAPPVPPPLLELPAELLGDVLARTPLVDLVRASGACVALRDAVDAFTAGASAGLRRVGLARTLNQGALCAALGLTADEARAFPHAVEKRRNQMGWYDTHVFDARVVVARLVDTRGWTGLRTALDAVQNKEAKREALEARRTEALEARRARFDAWLAKERPFGQKVLSLVAWRTALREKGAVAIGTDAVLAKFLEQRVATAPALKSAQEAARAFDVTQSARGECRAELLAALGVLGLTRRADSRICDAFEAGAPIAPFTTAARVADEMALMRWLHECTAYPQELRKCVEQLAENEGYYYEGINADARNETKARFRERPAVWPWLRTAAKAATSNA